MRASACHTLVYWHLCKACLLQTVKMRKMLESLLDAYVAPLHTRQVCGLSS